MIQKVLVVDDDPEMLHALRQGMSRSGDSFAVLTAGDGIEALECLRTHEISLVVTDLKMPRMHGLDLMAAILKSYPDIPVIVASGFSTPNMKRLARQRGAAAFIAKPFTIETLNRHIIQMLQKQTEGGILHGMPPSAFLQVIEMEQKTCTIRIEDKPSGRKGILFFLQGELVDARLGDAHGDAAAHEILAWDQVSLAIQDDCCIREKRIRGELCSLILEAARLRDENASLAPDAGSESGTQEPLPDHIAESARGIRTRIERKLGVGCGVGDAFQDPMWDERVKRLSRYGELLKMGKLITAYVSWGDPRDYIALPGERATVLPVNPKCSRVKIMHLLVG
jgi:CheY-like chemotaxis protein